MKIASCKDSREDILMDFRRLRAGQVFRLVSGSALFMKTLSGGAVRLDSGGESAPTSVWVGTLGAVKPVRGQFVPNFDDMPGGS